MSAKLYVGNLPFSTTDQELQEVFSSHGTVVSAKVITDRHTGRSRGFGFVEMSGEGEAEQAITAMNGAELGGRTLVVNKARPQEKRPPFGDSRRESSTPAMTNVGGSDEGSIPDTGEAS